MGKVLSRMSRWSISVKVECQYDEENPKADNQLDQALSTVQEEISESTQNR